MDSVGIRELKAHLSKYVKRVHSGESIVVTERGRPVAELRPVSPELVALDSLVSEGRVRWGRGKPFGAKGIRIRGGAIADTVLEDRR